MVPSTTLKRSYAKSLHRGTLSKTDKLDYISAVQCLMKKPSKTPASLVPAARSRFDDFIATHMNQTLTIHNTANFLTWHRYFTWLYEDALRTECGYKGAASPVSGTRGHSQGLSITVIGSTSC